MSEGIRKLDRAAVRTLAEKNSEELRQIAASGGNVYQRSLDQQDRVTQFAASMTEEESAAFLTMYAEELNACSMQTNAETARTLQQAQVNAQVNNHVAEAIAGLIALALGIFVFFMILK